MKLTNQDFIKRLSEKNPRVEPLEEYKNNKTKVRCRCKECGYEWFPYPNNLLRGEGCPKCTMKVSPTNEEFVQRVFSINPNIEPLEAYKRSDEKMLCRCRI